MTDYTDITNEEIESEQPVTNSLLTRLRDNLLGLIEGNSTNKIQTGAYADGSVTPAKLSFGPVVSSGTLVELFSYPTEIISGAVPPSKTPVFFVSQVSGTISYSFSIRTSSSGRPVLAQIYVNDVLVASESSTSTSYSGRSGNITIEYGDEVHLRTGEDGGLSSDCYVNNFILTCNY